MPAPDRPKAKFVWALSDKPFAIYSAFVPWASNSALTLYEKDKLNVKES